MTTEYVGVATRVLEGGVSFSPSPSLVVIMSGRRREKENGKSKTRFNWNGFW